MECIKKRVVLITAQFWAQRQAPPNETVQAFGIAGRCCHGQCVASHEVGIFLGGQKMFTGNKKHQVFKQNWAVLSDEQMSKKLQFSLLNNEQMSNWLGGWAPTRKILGSKMDVTKIITIFFWYVFVFEWYTLPETNIAHENPLVSW